MGQSLLQHKRVHMIGIKGAGMTALAELLTRQGIHVTGSDTEEIFFTDAILKRLEIPITQTFDPKNIPAHATLIV
jgi:UDP-N-acetylmuramate--alanine ligase